MKHGTTRDTSRMKCGEVERRRPTTIPPYVTVKTFEVKKYSFKGGHGFICITDREDEALPLGRVNGARFKAMIRKELEGNKYVHEGIKSLREDGDNLKDFRQISNLEAMLREFLVLILLFPFYFISLMYNRDIV
ncbi:hypothetical protein Tco_0753235 [Tanacetum coccineum]